MRSQCREPFSSSFRKGLVRDGEGAVKGWISSVGQDWGRGVARRHHLHWPRADKGVSPPQVPGKGWFPRPGPITPVRPILAPVGEEAGFVCLDNDHIEELTPVGAHHVPHPLVPGQRQREGRSGTGSSRVEGPETPLAARPTPPPHPGGSHEAEGAVGDEEQLLPMCHQAAQDSERLVPSQDVLL